jgi:hypothetical protein
MFFRKQFQSVLVFSMVMSAGWAHGSVVPLDGVGPDARGYSQLAEDWWKWALTIPAPQNPLLDNTGEFAHINQSGPVFYLAPTLISDQSREVTISPGQYLFFPVVTVAVVNGEDEHFTEAEMRTQLDDFLGATSVLYARLNDSQILHLFRYRVATPPGGFEVDLPDDNIYALPAGRYSPAVADGWWLLLEPLPVGQHTLRFEGGTDDPANPVLSTGVTYTIIVPEPSGVCLVLLAAAALLRRREKRTV